MTLRQESTVETMQHSSSSVQLKIVNLISLRWLMLTVNGLRIPLHWLLLDNQSAVDVTSNLKLLQDLQQPGKRKASNQ